MSELCEFCGKSFSSRGFGNHREACRKRHEISVPHGDSFQNLKTGTSEADASGEGQAINSLPSPETNTDYVPPEISADLNQEDINSDEIVSKLSGEQTQDEDTGLLRWVAAGAASLVAIGVGIALGGKRNV